MKPNRKIICLPILALALAILTLAPHGLAVPSTLSETSGEAEPPWLEETLFLGEAVPLQAGGWDLETLLLKALGDPSGTCRWLTDHGMLSLDELGQERPRQDTDYRLVASGGDKRLELIYRVRVESGTLTVRADQPALIRIEGGGLTLYQLARPEAAFTGLPFGIYTVSVEGGDQGAETCRLGLCQEDDTVDPARNTARLTLTLEDSSGVVASQRFRVEERS